MGSIYGKNSGQKSRAIVSLKMKNLPKWLKGLPISWFLWLLLLFRKSGSETVNEADIRRLWLSPSRFFSFKCSFSCIWTNFRVRTMPQSTLPPQSRTPNGGKDNLPDIAPTNFFSFREWSRSWLASRCPRTASRWASRGLSERSPKTSSLAPFVGE